MAAIIRERLGKKNNFCANHNLMMDHLKKKNRKVFSLDNRFPREGFHEIHVVIKFWGHFKAKIAFLRSCCKIKNCKRLVQ